MRTTLATLLLLVLLPAGVMAQRGRVGGGRQMQSRAQLESRVMQRFLEQSGREIGLDANEHARVQRWLQDSQARRRELNDEAAVIRQRLLDAVRDPNTSDAQFERVLNDVNQLREREHEMWKQDQQQLATLLPPRKRAQFVVRYLRLQDTIRDIIQQRDTTLHELGGPGAFGPPMVEGGNPFLGRTGGPEPPMARSMGGAQRGR